MTKKIKSKVYSEVYCINNVDGVSEKQMNTLLMCGDSNWDYFFSALVDKMNDNDEKIKNVELIEFKIEKDMLNFLTKLDREKLLDYSTSHKNPCVLKLV